ncbi:TolC family protein, partial [Bacteroides sp.]
RLATGDANRLETNKINLELLNVKTEAAMNETALRNKLEALTALNGNQPLAVDLATYPSVTLPADYEALRREALATDPTLQTLASESLVARKQVAVNKQNWLPQLELGYRRNTESGEPFNGVVVGFSFPLFQNRNKVKAARAQSLNIDLLRENTATQVSSELTQAYTEAQSLYASMEEYRKTFEAQQDLSLLKQALAGGQINMIEYFVELSVVYQSRQNYLLLENQYQKAVARIYKGLL